MEPVRFDRLLLTPGRVLRVHRCHWTLHDNYVRDTRAVADINPVGYRRGYYIGRPTGYDVAIVIFDPVKLKPTQKLWENGTFQLFTQPLSQNTIES